MPIPGFSYWLIKDQLPLWPYSVFMQNFFMAYAGIAGEFWIGVTWSLCVEEQFYLLFPFIYRAVSLSNLRYLCFIIILIAPACRFFAAKHAFYTEYMLTLCRMDSIAFGVLCSILIRETGHINRLITNISFLQIMAAISIFILLIILFKYQSLMFLWWSVMGITYAAFILIVISSRNRILHQIFCNKALVFLGAISYSVYMLHQLINGLMHGFILHQAPAIHHFKDFLVTLVSLIIVFIVATISYRILECPMQEYGKKLLKHQQVKHPAYAHV